MISVHLAAQSGDPFSLLGSHSEVVLALAAGVVWILRRLASAVTGAKGAARSGTAPAADADDERTRRVREEVRRKIAERRGGATASAPEPVRSGLPPAPPLVAPRPASESPGWSGMRGALERALRERAEAAQREFEKRREAEAARFEAQMREDEAREAVKAPPAAAPAIPGFLALRAAPERVNFAAKPPGPAEAASEGFAALLRDHAQARKAFVLREILGPPVALR